MTSPGLGSGIGAMPSHQLIIIPRRLGWWLRSANRFDFGAGQFLYGKHLPVATLEALVFHDRHEYQPVPSISGDGKRRPERFVLKVTKVPLELTRTDSLHLDSIRLSGI